MSKKLSAIDIIRAKLVEQENLRKEIEEVRKSAALDIGKYQEQIAGQEKVVADAKAKYEAENKVLLALKSELGMVSGKPFGEKRTIVREGAVKEEFKSWAMVRGQFTVGEMIPDVTPSGGYARILVTQAIAGGWLEQVADVKPLTYRIR